MSTALTYNGKSHYFGRNLDSKISYNETITISPRNFVFNFRRVKPITKHYSMIGMAYIQEGYPLYYDATNEKGLSMAGLNFSKYAIYQPILDDKNNIAPFELIPWVLSQCSNIKEVKELLRKTNLANIQFNNDLPIIPLHWFIADNMNSVAVEPTKDGLKIYDNPIGILTNSPPFELQMNHLNNFIALNNKQLLNDVCQKTKLEPRNKEIGIPGDYSSSSRFVRTAFNKLNSDTSLDTDDGLNQIFHILAAVELQRGYTEAEKDGSEITIYSSACNTKTGVYYYRTYDNNQINAVDMHKENIEGHCLKYYVLQKNQIINYQN